MCPSLHALSEAEETIRRPSPHLRGMVMQPPWTHDPRDNAPDGRGEAQLGVAHSDVEENEEHLWVRVGRNIRASKRIDQGRKSPVIDVTCRPWAALAKGVGQLEGCLDGSHRN